MTRFSIRLRESSRWADRLIARKTWIELARAPGPAGFTRDSAKKILSRVRKVFPIATTAAVTGPGVADPIMGSDWNHGWGESTLNEVKRCELLEYIGAKRDFENANFVPDGSEVTYSESAVWVTCATSVVMFSARGAL